MGPVNDHVIRRERDEVGTTVAEALADAAALCENAAEAAPLFRLVLARLEGARDEFETTYTTIEESDKKRLLRMFEDEIVKFTGDACYYCDASFTGRVLQHKKLTKRMKEIREGAQNVPNYSEGGLDELFRQLRNNRSVETDWERPLADAVRAFEASVLAMVEDDGVLKPFQDDPLVALEAATLLCKAEKKRDRLEWFDNKPAQILRDKITKIVESDDIKLPKWFVPESDINYRSRRFTQGAFGTLRYGTWGFGTKVVVKDLLTQDGTNQRLSNMLRKEFVAEADLWSKMSHPYVLKLYGACHVTSPPFLVCEDATNGNLATLLHEDKSRIWRLLFQTALAIEYLHGKDIVHGELKLGNVLIGSDGYVRVANFGLSHLRKMMIYRLLPSHSSIIDSSYALRWCAPEALDYKAIAESDIYSFGMCIIEALSGEIPYAHLDGDEVREHISNHKLPERPAAMSDEIWALVQQMTAFEPKDRATIEDVSTVFKKLANEEFNEETESTSLCQICSTKVHKITSYCEKFHRVQITKPMSKEVGNIQSKEDLPRVIEYLNLSDDQHEHKAPNALREYMFGMPDHQVEVYDAGAIPVLAKILTDKRKPNITMQIFMQNKIEAVMVLGYMAVANKKNQDAAKFERVMDSLKRELLSELSSDEQDNVELVKAKDRMRAKAVLMLAYMAHDNSEIRDAITSESYIMGMIQNLARNPGNDELQKAATRALLLLGEMPMTARIVDDVDLAMTGISNPTAVALSEAGRLCAQVSNGESSYVELHRRLVLLFNTLKANESRSSVRRDHSDDFSTVVDEFRRLLLAYRDMTFVERLLSVEATRANLAAVNGQAQTLCRKTGMDLNGDWIEFNKRDARRERLALEALANNPPEILHALRDPRQQKDASVLLKAEIEKIENGSSALSLESQLAVRKMFMVIVSSPSVGLTEVPIWLVMPSDIPYQLKPFTEDCFTLAHFGTLLEHGKVVVKFVRVTDSVMDQVAQNALRDEAERLYGLRHDHIVSILGANHVCSRPFIVMEHAENGTMTDYLAHGNNKSKMWQLLYEGAKGIQYLHSRNVVHADLKLKNILVSSGGKALVSDFGWIQIKSRNESKSHSMTKLKDGTEIDGGVRWYSPEHIKGEQQYVSDVYSYAMCIIEAFTGEPPYADDKYEDAVRHKIANHILPQRPEGLSNAAWTLIVKMTAFNPENRISMHEVVDVLKKFADKDDQGLLEAVKGGDVEDVLELLDDGRVDVDAADLWSEITPLHYASSEGDVKLVNLLLRANANPDAVDHLGRTPLFLAAHMGHNRVVELLLKASADLNIADKENQTPLHTACRWQNSEVARILLASGAQLSARDNSGRKPVHECILRVDYPYVSDATLETLRVLVAFGAKWDALCEEIVNEGQACKEAPALHVCMEFWCGQHARGELLTQVPMNIVMRGVNSTKAFFEDLNRVVLRHKICAVGASCSGKTSFFKSIWQLKPQLEPRDKRTVGVDFHRFQFERVSTANNTAVLHDVTVFDCSRHEMFDDLHSASRSPFTLYLVFVDLQTCIIDYLQNLITDDKQKDDMDFLDMFIANAIAPWIRAISAHQEDAEIGFIMSKADMVKREDTQESELIWRAQCIDQILMKLTSRLRSRFDRQDSQHEPQMYDRTAIRVDCTTFASVLEARASIEDVLLKRKQVFRMPEDIDLEMSAMKKFKRSFEDKFVTNFSTPAVDPRMGLKQSPSKEFEIDSAMDEELDNSDSASERDDQESPRASRLFARNRSILETMGDSSDGEWRQAFTAGDHKRGLVEAEVISAIEYDSLGQLLATGNKGGRVKIYSRNGDEGLQVITQPQRRQPLYAVYTEYQSHKPEFDCLKSLEVEERVNQIKWCRPTNNAQYLLSTNDKTIKLWKVHERNVYDIAKYNSQEHTLPHVRLLDKPYQKLSVHSIRLPQCSVRNRVTTSTPKRVYAHAHTYHINSIALNSDGETFMSADDLRVNLWSLANSNQSFNIVDIKPKNMEELTEVITAADFHPSQCNIMMYSTSRGAIKLGDMRQAALCDSHCKLYEEPEDPEARSFFSEIIASISDIKFSPDGRHIIARDFMTLKIWDINMDSRPVQTINIHEHLRPRLGDLYESDCIFDKFECAVSGDGNNLITGSYNSEFHIYDRYGRSDICISPNPRGASTASRRRSLPQHMLAQSMVTPATDAAPQSSGGAVDGLDFNKKVLQTSWHPTQNEVAVAIRNNVYVYSKNS